ncbi:MAG TPA: flagellar biosynthesis anti-sigma factor FlgM [Bryobacteraceae bacterium]|nr:flagellar biosynthesis anti-sigma factor FlgM [Bryobacteraceae bacterium]
MRIDDLNRTPQTHEAQRTGAAGAKTKNQAASQSPVSGDETHISEMASALSHGTSKVEALRLQIARGEYHVSSDEIAASLIDEHLLKR